MPRLPSRGKCDRTAVITNSSPIHNAHFAIGQFFVLRKLGFAFRAVEGHLKCVQVMLSANDRVHAASKAIGHGLLLLVTGHYELGIVPSTCPSTWALAACQ